MTSLASTPMRPPLSTSERAALMRRHSAAMKIVKEMPIEQRYDLLLAVLFPKSDLLRSLVPCGAVHRED